MKIENEFIPYEQALALKELGFDEECLYSFEYGNGGLECKLNPQLKTNSTCDIGEIVAPLWQQAFRWLYQKLDIEKGLIPLDIEHQQLLLKELIEKVSSKHLLV